ncbi:MAG: B12-binding domain-containing radical SAM protein [Pirellulaceae bacterium]
MMEHPVDFPVHPLGSQSRVLLTSVFGPYAQDDQYGSRVINPMELYHNQVTRVQQAFSFRSFFRSWGLMLIQVNLQAPCTLLDFPSQERFLEEIQARKYDVIGISSIIPNLFKVRRMCRLIRKYQPAATIVVGGHIANVPDLLRWVDVDHVVQGDGIRWMRKFLGQDEHQPIVHPRIISDILPRIMGVPLHRHPGIDDAVLIPSVGCPMGCNFCSTSAMFGGKGKHLEFYRTGQELFEIMCELEADLRVQEFFVMDENFLLNKKRALQLLDLMEQHGKPWSLKVFSSIKVLHQYTMEQLVALGVVWVWLGLEGKDSRYEKRAGTDSIALVRSLQSHGIRVLGSSIIGLEEHTPENIDAVIEHAVAHDTDLHQFMLYTPIPGTPLFAELDAQGAMLGVAEMSPGDIHGQLKFNYRHPHIRGGEETEFILRAFHRDFAVNGPSVVRIVRTLLRGWVRYKNHPDPRIRARFAHEAANLPVKYAGALWAARRLYRDDPHRFQLISGVLDELYTEFGWKARLAAPIVGFRLCQTLRSEDRRLLSGWTYEPPTFFETNSDDGPPAAVRVTGITASAASRGTPATVDTEAIGLVELGTPASIDK